MTSTRFSLIALLPGIESFESLTRAGRFDEACLLFRDSLHSPTLFGLEPSLHRARLLTMMFEEGSAEPALRSPEDRQFVLYSLALALNLTGGFPGQAIPLYERHNQIARGRGDFKALAQGLGHHAKALRQTGRFFESEVVAREGLAAIRQVGDPLKEAVNLYWLGMGLAHRGEALRSELALARSLRIFRARFEALSSSVVSVFMAQRALWLGRPEEALGLARDAGSTGRRLLADPNHLDEHGAVKVTSAAVRMEGEALTLLGEVDQGETRLAEALDLARSIDFVEEELPALRALALSSLRQGRLEEARQRVDATFVKAERGPFALYSADSFSIKAAIEERSGNKIGAAHYARRAYELSWCDGPPYAYEKGLIEARDQLRSLAARGESRATSEADLFRQLCVAEPRNTPGIPSVQRLDLTKNLSLATRPDFHHGLLGETPPELPPFEGRSAVPVAGWRPLCGDDIDPQDEFGLTTPGVIPS